MLVIFFLTFTFERLSAVCFDIGRPTSTSGAIPSHGIPTLRSVRLPKTLPLPFSFPSLPSSKIKAPTVSQVMHLMGDADELPSDLYDYEQSTSRLPVFEDIDFEPMMPLAKDKEKTTVTKNINCDDFSKYALNCTVEAALIYNSSRKSPPMPAKIGDWCKAIRHLTSCAIDWNADCKDVTESHFNEESIKGHMHVVSSVCDDEWFLTQYDLLPQCIENASSIWERCYTEFKNVVDGHKNTTHEWTHFETHFFLCCARAKFRRCTLDALFGSPAKCHHEQAVTLQKFSVIVSEGDVFQDCDHNMMYSNCPGGDPRPSGNQLEKLMNAEGVILNKAQKLQNLFVLVFCLVNALL